MYIWIGLQVGLPNILIRVKQKYLLPIDKIYYKIFYKICYKIYYIIKNRLKNKLQLKNDVQ